MTMNWRLCALLSAFFAALTAILGKVGVRGVNSNLATAVRVTVILLFSWGLVLATGATGQLRQWSARSWLFVALSGMATGLSWLFYFHALKLESASKVAPVDKLSVPMTPAGRGAAGGAPDLADRAGGAPGGGRLPGPSPVGEGARPPWPGKGKTPPLSR